MFYLIGMGLNQNQLTREALQVIAKCSRIYLESYTSRLASGTIPELSKLVKKKIKILDRSSVEENAVELMKEAKKKNVAVLVIGNPLFATTHDGLITLAKQKKVKCEIVVGIGIQDYLGLTELNPYKFGRVVTLVKPQPQFAPESFFDQLMENKKMGLHTLCLLDIQSAQNYLMAVPEAIALIESIAAKRNVSTQDWLAAGMMGMGNKKGKVIRGTFLELKKKKWTLFPQCLVVAGQLNEMEKEQWGK